MQFGFSQVLLRVLKEFPLIAHFIKKIQGRYQLIVRRRVGMGNWRKVKR
jgi:hypothetical protein